MKLQVSFDLIDLNNTLEIASHISSYIDIIEIGTPLIYRYGTQAIEQIKQQFPDKSILINTKIIDHGKEIIELYALYSIDWITVMAGTSSNTIHSTTTIAHQHNIKIMLDLTDANSVGLAASEAKTLGIDAILFNEPYNQLDSLIFLDTWDMIKGNTQLPIFIAAKTNRTTIHEIINLNPDGIILNCSSYDLADTIKEIEYIAKLLKKL